MCFLQKRNADLTTLKSNQYEVGKLKTGLRALVEGTICVMWSSGAEMRLRALYTMPGEDKGNVLRYFVRQEEYNGSSGF